MTHHERLASKILSLKKFLSQLESVFNWLDKNKAEISKFKELSLSRKKDIHIVLVSVCLLSELFFVINCIVTYAYIYV